MDLRKDIYFYADFASFPANGSTGVLYVDKDTGFIYSWNGSTYLAAGTGGLNYLGTWNANTNSPTITSGVGSNGDYYIVGTPGTTSIDGISSWDIGDWIIFGGSAWQKIDNSETTGYVTSVGGTAPIASSGGTTPTISISQANGSTDGYLSSTDWTTFNNKVSSNIYTANGTVTGNRTIDLNGNTLKFSNGIVEFDQGSSNSGEIRLYEDSDFGTNKVFLRAPQAMASDVTFFFPPNNGTNGYVLSTNGAGATSWIAASGGLTKFTEAESTSAPNGTVYVDSLTAAASSTNADFAIKPKGNGAFILAVPDNTTTGGNKRGQYAVDLQFYRSNANQVASGNYTFVVGTSSRATSSNDVAIGSDCLSSGGVSMSLNGATASGSNATAIGRIATSSGNQSFSIGGYSGGTISSGIASLAAQGSISSGDYSFSVGYQCIANSNHSVALGRESHTFGIIGRQAYASGIEGTTGDAQASKFILRERTTGNTATTLTSDSGSASTNNQVILSNQSAYRFKGSIVGKQSGSVNAAVWDIDGFIVRGANAAATTLNISNVTLVQNTPAWGTPTLAADTTNGGLQVQVIGAAATNIQWTAVIETTEVIYA